MSSRGVVTAVANLKGGVGKTTSTNGLAHAGASQGKRVLIVDADMQGNITESWTLRNPRRGSLTDYT